MIAFKGDAGLKADVVAGVEAHAAADEIIQGQYWEGGKGCAVGCLTHDPGGGHALFPGLFGLPVWFAYLVDTVFEELPAEAAKGWPLRVMSAVPVGADLDGLWMVLNAERLRVEVLPYAGDASGVVEAMLVALESGDSNAIAARAALTARTPRAAGAARSAWDAGAARAEFWVREADRIVFALQESETP